jgi:D-tyrosyl-tRNA(Tyr) deacylase
MIGLLQRVTEARVTVRNEEAGAIGAGIVVLVCAEPDDTPQTAERLFDRLLAYRMFGDEAGRMNRSVQDIDGAVLLVPQFTLAADTTRGTRPSFSSAADPAKARALFEHLLNYALARHPAVASGRFGEHMQVSLVNDGPVTFWMRVPAAG